MFAFLVKKAFFDMWDNMFRILLMNLGYVLILAYLVLIAPLFAPLSALFTASVAVGIALFTLYTGVVSGMCSVIVDYQPPGFTDLVRCFKESYASSLLLALAVAAYIFVVSIAFQFYGGLKSVAGPFAVAVLFWLTVGWVFASQYFFPIQSRLDRQFKKILRKTLLVFFDNPAFSIGLFLFSAVVLVASLFTFLLLPGISSILLLWNAAFKIRLYKYEWLEQNPGASKRRIPWDALLIEDRTRVGKRTLKGMIFPWKE
jgi:uncharacterized membrane protein